MTYCRSSTCGDLPGLKKLWLSCFDERPDAAELFFSRNKNAFHAYVCESDGTLVSALYLIGCILNGSRAHYLCGAATLPEYRGRGLMSELIAFALRDAEKRGDRYSLLLPANESLYGYYARFGYLPTCAVKSAVISTDTDRESLGGSPNLQALQASCNGNSLIWEDAFIRFAALYYGCYGASAAQSANAFAIFQPDGDFAEMIYAVYQSTDDLKALMLDEGVKSFRLTGAADDPRFDGELSKPFGMLRPLCGDPPPENAYIGITMQ